MSIGLLVCHINRAEYEVKGLEGVPFRVDLEKKVCSCLAFDMLRIPCVHAIAAAIQYNIRMNALVDENFTRNTWFAAYSMSISPTGDYMTPPPEAGTLGSIQLAPLITRRPSGRPRKTRILSRGEFKVL